MINYHEISEFQKDFKNLLKRFRTLEKDFEIMKKYTIETHHIKNVPSSAIFKIEGFCGEKYTSNKIKKFACMSLSGKGSNSKIRVIYVYEEKEKKVTFIEIYFKGDKANEDRDRLKNFIDALII